MKGPRPLSAEQKAAIDDMVRAGNSPTKTARELHIYPPRVYRYLSGDTSPEEADAQERDRVREAITHGWSRNKIISHFGISRLRANKIIEQLGYVPESDRRSPKLKRESTIAMEPWQWNYVAGSFDANGGFTVVRSAGRPIVFRGRRDHIARLEHMIGTGAIKHGKNTSTITVTPHVDVLALCRGMLPYSTEWTLLERMAAHVAQAIAKHVKE